MKDTYYFPWFQTKHTCMLICRLCTAIMTVASQDYSGLHRLSWLPRPFSWNDEKGPGTTPGNLWILHRCWRILVVHLWITNNYRSWTLDNFLVRACKTTGKVIVNFKIQEEAIASSCLMLATPMRPQKKITKKNYCTKINYNENTKQNYYILWWLNESSKMTYKK